MWVPQAFDVKLMFYDGLDVQRLLEPRATFPHVIFPHFLPLDTIRYRANYLHQLMNYLNYLNPSLMIQFEKIGLVPEPTKALVKQ